MAINTELTDIVLFSNQSVELSNGAWRMVLAQGWLTEAEGNASSLSVVRTCDGIPESVCEAFEFQAGAGSGVGKIVTWKNIDPDKLVVQKGDIITLTASDSTEAEVHIFLKKL